MSFAQVGNDLNKYELLYLQHKLMKHYEEKIDYATVVAYSFPQYSLKRVLKKLGPEEMFQIHMRNTFFPKSAEHLIEEQKRDALEYLIFLKVKRNRRVKGRI